MGGVVRVQGLGFWFKGVVFELSVFGRNGVV